MATEHETNPQRNDRPVGPPARERPPVPPPPGSDDSLVDAPVGRGSRAGRGWLIFLVFIGVWNLFLILPLGGQSAAAIPYSELVTQADRGNVATVEFDGQAATGSFVEPVLWPPTAETPAASAAPAAATGTAAG